MRTLSPTWRRVVVGQWIMIAVMSVAVTTLYVDNKRTRDCISDYMVVDQQNTSARVQISDSERAKFLEMLTIIFVDDSTTPTERRQAGIDYINEVNKNDELRKQQPVLPVPTDCD